MSVSSHLDPAELRLFLTGILSAKESERVEQHVRDCAACRELLAQLRGEAGGTDPGRNQGPLDETREIPSSERDEVIEFIEQRAPELGHGRAKAGKASSSGEMRLTAGE